ncbi:efflux transporter outer membrane subunit [Acidisphaera sp. S103]|uniref:efflux transporter outer membrane subunit n=1 Tax=Acidisphaera sp. S103 TaxID=1747223 RepID=UPI001C20A085|nr:efflux transporter outer membrane subunit [Acidisphaera sp. S103]
MGRIVLIAVCVAGCTVGPDFRKPDPPAVTGYTRDALPPQTVSAPVGHGSAQRFVSDMDIPAEWWHVFHSEPLNALIRDSLAANPNLTAAQAALRQAHETVLAQRGAFFPSIEGELNASRNLTPTATLSPAGPTANPYYSLITPQLNVSFVPDVWGANTRAVESAAAQEQSQRFQLEATYLTLTANVVTGAVQEASLRGQIAATEQTIKVEASLLDILHRQMALGQTAGADVAAQQAALAQAQLLLPPLRKQLAQQRDALTALAGRYPSQEVEATFDLDGLALPKDLPVSVPSKLVEQRPDILQAEANLHAASAQIGQAVAARIPQITLTADIGNSASSAGSLFTPGTNFWTIAGGVTGPIFDGFTLLHKQRAAQAAFDQAAAQYKATVIAAFQNVADTLRALQSDADALKAASTAEAAAARSLAIVRKQLDLGQVAYLAVLNAENTHQQARLALVQTEANRLTDTAALFQALGGGWWHRTDDRMVSR